MAIDIRNRIMRRVTGSCLSFSRELVPRRMALFTLKTYAPLFSAGVDFANGDYVDFAFRKAIDSLAFSADPIRFFLHRPRPIVALGDKTHGESIYSRMPSKEIVVCSQAREERLSEGVSYSLKISASLEMKPRAVTESSRLGWRVGARFCRSTID
jgi:hypothetical protein